MNALRKTMVASAILTVGLYGMAFAATLTTPTLFRGSVQNVCIATNVGTEPIEVTVTMIGFSSSDSQTCTLEPGDPSGCQAFVDDLAYCQVTAAGAVETLREQLRVVMINRQTTVPFTIHAVVEAR
jgi:hypothetical protein